MYSRTTLRLWISFFLCLSALLISSSALAEPAQRIGERDSDPARYWNLPILFLADRIIAVADLDGWKEGSGSNFGTTIESWHFKPAAP